MTGWTLILLGGLLPLVVLLVAMAWIVRAMWNGRSRRLVELRQRCWNCGADLRGMWNKVACPKCGEFIESEEPNLRIAGQEEQE